MNRKKRINDKLKRNLKDFQILIEDNSHLHKGHNNFTGNNETHILVEIKRESKFKINRLDLHRKINLLLNDEFKTGLHSLQIKII